MTANDVITKRESTHGDFRRVAETSQALRAAFRHFLPERVPDPVVAEALDMIAVKLARICHGDAGYQDHWVDIRGYALLAMECRWLPADEKWRVTNEAACVATLRHTLGVTEELVRKHSAEMALDDIIRALAPLEVGDSGFWWRVKSTAASCELLVLSER